MFRRGGGTVRRERAAARAFCRRYFPESSEPYRFDLPERGPAVVNVIARRGSHASPLRYPGGKATLAGFFESTMNALSLNKPTYFEPYAGGAGAGLELRRGRPKASGQRRWAVALTASPTCRGSSWTWPSVMWSVRYRTATGSSGPWSAPRSRATATSESRPWMLDQWTVFDTFGELGIYGEGYGDGTNILALNIPAGAEFRRIKAALEQGQADGRWAYEEGSITRAWTPRDPSGKPARWPARRAPVTSH